MFDIAIYHIQIYDHKVSTPLTKINETISYPTTVSPQNVLNIVITDTSQLLGSRPTYSQHSYLETNVDTMLKKYYRLIDRFIWNSQLIT